jgi:hypothetical protein
MSKRILADKQQIMLLLVLIAIAIGFYVRLDQFLIQTLIDDEWHAVHQLLQSTPTRIATSFGHADYSIPLTLLYWFEARYFGLSELLMRWPMMLFGLATIVVFPMYVYRQFSQQEAVLFGFLLALSPVLTIFSRTARPYAITLFLVYLSVWAFYKCYDRVDDRASNNRLIYGAVYCLTAALAVWLHLIVVFFVFSPFAVELVRLLFKSHADKKRNFVLLLFIGVPALLVTLALILPPLLSSFNALTVKAGSHLPSLDTLIGAVYIWLGTASGMMVIICYVLATIGLSRLIKKSIITVNILVGFVLTFVLIVISQPAWVKHPFTLARYLLPIIPLLLLSIASGIYVLHNRLIKQRNLQYSSFVYMAASVCVVIGLIASSPLVGLLHQPNSNTLHPVFHFEFRPEENDITQYLLKHSYSDFWKSFSNFPPQSKKIAIAPWYFESHFWHAPIWEKTSNQDAVPGFLLGLCVKERAGEVPDSPRFRFRNVSYLANPQDLKRRGIDFIVYQKPNRLNIKTPYTNISECDVSLQKIYGQPIYEDTIIKVYNPKVTEST